jgi:glycosyltransferase involved in cell wall biosynthesis
MEQIKKKILLLSTGDVNGAYEAIYRLAKLFHKDGHQVAMLVKSKSKFDSFIYLYREVIFQKRKSIFERVLNKIFSKFKKPKNNQRILFNEDYDFISTNETLTNVSSEEIVKIIGFTPDIIYSGMTDKFMNSTDIFNLQQLTKAQVYTITVDMNHFTGGCHFAWECEGYIKGCNECPAIISDFGKETAKINFETKLLNASKGNFKIISGSGWTLKQAKESKIYKNQSEFYNINSLIDTEVFNNKSRSFAKQIFGLSDSTFYILMGCQNSNNKRKGFEYLIESLHILHQSLNQEQKSKIKVLLVSRLNNLQFDEIPFEKEYIEYINDYRLLSLLYQASDLFVNSSIEDSGPMMVSEALACGTPVVGFDMGVVNNMVITEFNGYKAKLKDAKDLAYGMQHVFELSKNDYAIYSQNGVDKVKNESSLEYAKTIFDKIHNCNI